MQLSDLDLQALDEHPEGCFEAHQALRGIGVQRVDVSSSHGLSDTHFAEGPGARKGHHFSRPGLGFENPRHRRGREATSRHIDRGAGKWAPRSRLIGKKLACVILPGRTKRMGRRRAVQVPSSLLGASAGEWP